MANEQVLRTVPMGRTVMVGTQDKGQRILYLLIPQRDLGSVKFPAVGSSHLLKSDFINQFSLSGDQMVWAAEEDVEKVLARAVISRSGDAFKYTIGYVEPGYELPDVDA